MQKYTFFVKQTFFQDEVEILTFFGGLGGSLYPLKLITSVANGDFRLQDAQKTKAVPETTHKTEAKNAIKLIDLDRSYNIIFSLVNWGTEIY